MTAALFVEAVDTTVRVGWALAAWIILLAAVASLALWTVLAAVCWVARGVWRACAGAWRRLLAPHRASRDSRAASPSDRPADGRTARPVPSWAHTDHHTDPYEEAA